MDMKMMVKLRGMMKKRTAVAIKMLMKVKTSKKLRRH